MNSIRPQEHLIAAGKIYPNAWKQVDDLRSARGKDLPNWPDWCFLPMSGWYAIISAATGMDRLPVNLVGDVGRLAALGTWRVSQGIYRFDPMLYEAVSSTPVVGDIPCEVLYHLPEWCVYIETPGLLFDRTPQYGFFTHLEWDANTQRHELRLLLDIEATLLPIPVHIGPWSLDESLGRMVEESQRQANTINKGDEFPTDLPSLMRPHIEPMISLLLYLCTESADYGGVSVPTKPHAQKTKHHGRRIFPPDKPRIWDMGIRLGAALKRASESSGQGETSSVVYRSRPRAHIRRAHWHTFRIGKGREKLKINWLPPIPVNVESPDDLPAVIKKIKQ